MSKITKEGVEAVLSVMMKLRDHPIYKPFIGPIEFDFMKESLERCMEKPFPSFEMDVSCYDETRVIGKLFISKIEDRIEFKDTAERKSINLSKNEFLKMTEACQKIFDWIKSEKSSPC